VEVKARSPKERPSPAFRDPPRLVSSRVKIRTRPSDVETVGEPRCRQCPSVLEAASDGRAMEASESRLARSPDKRKTLAVGAVA
jgi:hypothetical protein